MTRRPAGVLGAVGLLATALGPAAASTRGDSFDPIRMSVRVARVARVGRPLAITVTVSADPSVLDVRSGPVRVRAKLAATACGGDFAHTVGTVMLDKRLHPQPQPGRAYSGRASAKRRPIAYGVHPLCVFLTDDYEQFASDTSDYAVNVSRSCSRAAARYDRRRTARRRRLARRACGRGVPL